MEKRKMGTVTISREVLAAIGRSVTEAVDAKLEQIADSHQLTRSQLVRIEALNIASREAVVRSYNGTKNAVEIATEMVAFIEDPDTGGQS